MSPTAAAGALAATTIRLRRSTRSRRLSGGNRFLPETTKDIEVGLKYSGDGIGVPLTFNADFFHQWVKNIQRAAYIS